MIINLILSPLTIFTWCLFPGKLEAESGVLLLLFRADRPELRMRLRMMVTMNLESVLMDPWWDPYKLDTTTDPQWDPVQCAWIPLWKNLRMMMTMNLDSL